MDEKKSPSLPIYVAGSLIAFALLEVVIYYFFPVEQRRNVMIGAAIVFVLALGGGYAANLGRKPRQKP